MKGVRSWRLYIDVQFMQTGAFGRGMGQHIRGLVKSMVGSAPNSLLEIVFLYTSNLSDDNIKIFKNELRQIKSGATLSYVPLDLKVHDLEVPGSYDDACRYNQSIAAEYCKDTNEHDLWFVACPMQEPVVPVLPRGAAVRTAVLWFDLMPYLMHDHYFPDQTTPFAHSYLSRINNLLEYDMVMTISETSKADLARFISLDPREIVNTKGAANTELVGDGKMPQGVTRPFILLNASAEPNKNVKRAMQAFRIFNETTKGKYQLVVTSDYTQEMAKAAEDQTTNIYFSGHVSSADLKELYEQCAFVFFPSLYEGLGLAGLESINFSKKVVCADIPVLREFDVDDAFYWCDPYDIDSMAHALDVCAMSGDGLSAEQIEAYDKAKEIFSWDRSAEKVFSAISSTKKRKIANAKIAIVGPHPSSFSSIGKFVSENYPYLARHGEVDYFYDQGPSDRRHGRVKFNYLQASKNLRPVSALLPLIDRYDHVIYHMGNSDHHMVTYLLAHAAPKTLVLHDTDLGGRGLSGQMLSSGLISQERLIVENDIETEYLKLPRRFISSLVSVQEKIVTHSDYAHDVASSYIVSDQHIPQKRLEHPMLRVDFRSPKNLQNRPLRYGIAGIMTEIKGINTIDWLMQQTDNLAGAELYIFGFGFFADRTALLALAEKYHNVKVEFDLTDFEFNNRMSQLDFLINFRETYKGEASRATLEAMRERVIPIVRSIGWFDELPDSVAYKIQRIEEIADLINMLNKSKPYEELESMIANGQKLLDERFNPADYIKELL